MVKLGSRIRLIVRRIHVRTVLIYSAFAINMVTNAIFAPVTGGIPMVNRVLIANATPPGAKIGMENAVTFANVAKNRKHLDRRPCN